MNRDLWTKKLTRIIAAIEAGEMPATVRELYIFGSYARGAIECKDLDLVVVHDEPPTKLMEELKKKAKAKARTFLDGLVGHELRFKALMGKAIRRPGEDIDILIGQDLPSILQGRPIQESELRLVWSATDGAWQKKLGAIQVDANAGSAPRAQFISPKLAQSTEDDVNGVTSLLAEQALILTRIRVETLEAEPLPDEWAQTFLRRRWGTKSRALLPFAFAWFGSQNVESIDVREPGEIWDGERRFRVQLGRLYLYWMVKLFQEEPKLQRQCLIPHFRRVYAKELLIFERGPAWESRTDPWR